MITIKQRGDFSKLTGYLERIKHVFKASDLDKYGRKGVELLSEATPVDSGLTASSWDYSVDISDNGASISFFNTNINDGAPIAILLQYGHGTRNGGWVAGRDYINPAIQPLFDEIANEAWKEVTRV
jgi:hypothetical protein